MKAFDKAIVISDKLGPYANNWTEKVGGERWWPTSHDFSEEVAKCTRILHAFTVDGVEQKVAVKTGLKTQGKAFMKIPATVLRDAKAIAVYSSMRTGLAPLGGAGGSGLIVARLPDGSWSAPSCIAPATITGGLMFGVDIFEAVLVVNTDEALKSFYSHKITLGGQLAVTAGLYGAGALADVGKDRKPVLSYMRSRGAYIGAEAVASAYLCRFDENEREYGCMGVTQREILTGHFRPTSSATPFYAALRDAETGHAQRQHGAEYEFAQPFETKDAGATPVTNPGGVRPREGALQKDERLQGREEEVKQEAPPPSGRGDDAESSPTQPVPPPRSS
ncbi:ysc84 actin-binding domain protein [Rhodotorula toruloides]|uniref:Ysc84 actin-binding domain protein n=1 Tax=Rhodotorula toruloides TaxID=5286 RepID=A0A511KA73_RHOTO|nr:ysc84 actin-binding domain protein [Rhodotorula toruloides]